MPVSPVPDVRGEEGYRDSRIPNTVELVLPRGLAVLDTVPVVGPWIALQSLLVGVQDGLDRGVTIAVCPDLPARRVGVCHHPVELFLGPYQVVVGGLGLAMVGLPQRRGAYLDGPVLEELHRQGTYPFGISGPLQSRPVTPLQLLPERIDDRRAQPHGEPAVLGDARIRLGVPHPVGEPQSCVHDGGDAGVYLHDGGASELEAVTLDGGLRLVVAA